MGGGSGIAADVSPGFVGSQRSRVPARLRWPVVARVTIVQEAAFANVAAQRIAALIAQSISSHGTASVSLTGGSTPRAAYEALADPSRPWRTQVEWGRV